MKRREIAVGIKDGGKIKRGSEKGAKKGKLKIPTLPERLVRLALWTWSYASFDLGDIMTEFKLTYGSAREYLRQLSYMGIISRQVGGDTSYIYLNASPKFQVEKAVELIKQKITLKPHKTYDFDTLTGLADSEDSKRKGTKPTDPHVEKVAKPQKDLMKLKALAAHNIQKRQSIIRAMLKQEEEDGRKLLDELDKVLNTHTREK